MSRRAGKVVASRANDFLIRVVTTFRMIEGGFHKIRERDATF